MRNHRSRGNHRHGRSGAPTTARLSRCPNHYSARLPRNHDIAGVCYPSPSLMSVQERLHALSSGALQGMRRGIEKESLRVRPDGSLAQTPHPVALGSALTHPHITTDFSESQLELITGVHASVEDCLEELTHIHQVVYKAIGEEIRWCARPLSPGASTSSRSSRREPTMRRTRRRCAWGAWATRATRRPRSA